jgi:hypothetical protein
MFNFLFNRFGYVKNYDAVFQKEGATIYSILEEDDIKGAFINPTSAVNNLYFF